MKFIYLTIMIVILNSITIYALEGFRGYEGGISSGEVTGKTIYEYQEVCFLTGIPIILKGKLTIKKAVKSDMITTTYTYNLSNIERNATLSRSIIFNTKITTKDNDQKIEETVISGNPTESVKIGNTTYTLTRYDFSRSSLNDLKPAINYYAGNLWSKKTYNFGTNSGVLTLNCDGKFYGYDQYWGNTESMILDYYIESVQKDDRWGGSAKVSISSSVLQKIQYEKNEPTEISFEGSYLKKQQNTNILEYNANLPGFDSNSISTDEIINYSNKLSIETFPLQTRLISKELKNVRGHWAEEDINKLFSLEILKGEMDNFIPENYISRGTFTSAIVNVAKEVPNANQAKVSLTKTKLKIPFNDVFSNMSYYDDIVTAYNRKFVVGVSKDSFLPTKNLIIADALCIIIKSLGLESIAPNPSAVTPFKDNDQIPDYARDYVYVAYKIGLVTGDDRGYLKPLDSMSNARAAAFINRYIEYMRDGLIKDYRNRIF